MALVMCSECGNWFSNSDSNCPKCGFSSKVDVKNNDVDNRVENETQITDTGYKYEKVIKGCADFLFWSLTIGSFLLYIIWFIVIISNDATGASGFVLFSGIIGVALCVIVAYIIRAFLMVYSNISINLHEINMKLQ